MADTSEFDKHLEEMKFQDKNRFNEKLITQNIDQIDSI